MLTLQELCCRAIVARTTVYGIDQLPLPNPIKSHLKSYAMTTYTTMPHHPPRLSAKKMRSLAHQPPSPLDQRSCAGRNSCILSWCVQLLCQRFILLHPQYWLLQSHTVHVVAIIQLSTVGQLATHTTCVFDTLYVIKDFLTTSNVFLCNLLLYYLHIYYTVSFFIVCCCFIKIVW